MKSNRIVFVPVIAVIAGFSVFVAVLLICLDLVPAHAEEKRGGGSRAAVADELPVNSPSQERETAIGPGRQSTPRNGDGEPHLEEPKREAGRPDRNAPAPGAEDATKHLAQAREKMEALNRQGRRDEAQRIASDLMGWMKEQGFSGIRSDSRSSRDVAEPGKREETEQRAREDRGERDQDCGAPAGQIGERIRHVREAAEHLDLAGFPGDAEELRDRAEEMGRHDRGAAERIERLVHQVEELQAAMAGMREKMERMHNEFGERRERD